MPPCLGVRTSELGGWQRSGGHDLFFLLKEELEGAAAEGDEEETEGLAVRSNQKKKNIQLNHMLYQLLCLKPMGIS